MGKRIFTIEDLNFQKSGEYDKASMTFENDVTAEVWKDKFGGYMVVLMNEKKEKISVSDGQERCRSAKKVNLLIQAAQFIEKGETYLRFTGCSYGSSVKFVGENRNLEDLSPQYKQVCYKIAGEETAHYSTLEEVSLALNVLKNNGRADCLWEIWDSKAHEMPDIKQFLNNKPKESINIAQKRKAPVKRLVKENSVTIENMHHFYQDGRKWDLYSLPENFMIKSDVILDAWKLDDEILPDLSHIRVDGEFACYNFDNETLELPLAKKLVIGWCPQVKKIKGDADEGSVNIKHCPELKEVVSWAENMYIRNCQNFEGFGDKSCEQVFVVGKCPYNKKPGLQRNCSKGLRR